MKFELTFGLVKQTTGAFRLEEIVEPGVPPVVGTLYLKKVPLAAAGIKEPVVIKVTIEIDT